jgi:tetrapyrrole methylase family protein/MazG family protein
MTLPELAPIFEQLNLDPLEHGLQLIDVSELVADSFPRLDTDRPALVFHVSTAELAAATQTLLGNYPPAHQVTLVRAKKTESLDLSALSTHTPIRNAVLYLPPLAYASSPLTLANIMARLRAPNGCPWDIEQTHESITRSLVEETYEVIEAISDKDMPHLTEELGDLFLHVLFQTQIARDEGSFRFSDVGGELAAKLIRRHPHVFGTEQAANSGVVLQNWEKIKQQEKASKGQTPSADTLDTGIPRDLPALTRAQKVAERARRKKLGLPDGALGAELVNKVSAARAAQRERVLGDLFLELAALAESKDIDAERALQAATKRFVEAKRNE